MHPLQFILISLFILAMLACSLAGLAKAEAEEIDRD
jgi:hypothetical protein